MFDTTLIRQNSKENITPRQPTFKYKTSFKNCILKALKNRNWKEAEDDNDWDLYWGEKENVQNLLDQTHLNANQRVNHFRNHYELTKKDHLMRNLKKYKRQLEKEGRVEEANAYDFFPMTYNLPLEYPIFCDEFKKNGNSVWIMKPIGRSQGKGIFLFNKLSEVSNWKLENRWKSDTQVEDYVVQKYIANPLLIGGKKFDLRIYCLVTSFAPLTVYFYREGFARFTHHRYTNHDLSNTYVHLTNVAIQKTSENYDEKLGGKWELSKLKQYLISKYGNTKIDECFLKIQNLVLHTIQSVQKLITNDKHCFELYGFDVLLDDNFKPWLLEVNGSPSMTANTTQDAKLKCALLNDVFTIIDLEKKLTGTEEKIGGFDLISKPAPAKPTASVTVNSVMLGTLEDRTNFFNSLIKEMISNSAPRKATPPERQSKPGRLLLTPNTKEKLTTTPTSEEKSRETNNLSIPKASSTGNIFLTPQSKSRKVFLFDSSSIKRYVTDGNAPEISLNTTSRAKRIQKMPQQPVASLAQLKEIMHDIKLISGTKVSQQNPEDILKPKPNGVIQPRNIMPLPFVNLAKGHATIEDARALLPKKRSQAVNNNDVYRPLTAKSIRLVASDNKVSKEGAKRMSVAEKKILRPSTSANNSVNNSRDLPEYKALTDTFNIFGDGKTKGKTLADSLLITQVKCENSSEGDASKGNKENKPSGNQNEEVKRPVKTCRIKLWSGKLNLQRKESKGDVAGNLAKSLKSSGVFKERKVDVNM